MPRRLAVSSVSLAFVLAVASAAATPEGVGRLTYLGYAALPPDTTDSGTPVGGLSGLAWDERTGLFWAISDDRSERAEARVVKLRVDLSDGRLDPSDVTVAGVTFLRQADGKAYPPRSIDAEGIALTSEAMYVSSEGDADAGISPFVGEYGRDGQLRRLLPLPEKYVPGRPGHGVRNNQGFEALTLARDGRTLWVGAEGPLQQDGPAADAGVSARARVRRIDLRGELPEREVLVTIEAVAGKPASPTTFRLRGLVDLVALDGGRLLSLEREYVAGDKNRILLYELETDGATDVAAFDTAPADARPAGKRLLLDLEETGAPVENVEGLAFGPRLPDGRETLFLISDDNFFPVSKGTQLFAFAVSPGPTPIPAIQGPGHRSPLAGQWLVGVEGVVTAVDASPKGRGFFVESATPDGDRATSEGIFVSWETGDLPPAGAGVSVNGRVEEVAAAKSLPVTRLAGRSVTLARPGAVLPAPVRLFRDRTPPPANVDDDSLARFEPDSDAVDFWESLEGMRVELPGGTVIGPTSAYGDVTLLPDGVEGLPGRTRRGGVRPGPTGPDLRRALLSRRFSGTLPDVSVGTRLAGPITGIVDYTFGSYRIQPLAPPKPEGTVAPCAAKATPAPPGSLSLATFNAENLSAVSPPAHHAALARHVVEALGAPAVVALQEIQDDSGPAADGTVTSRGTLATLVAAIRKAGGPGYEPVWIDPEDGKEGGQPGGNIRVALLLDPARVSLPRRGTAGTFDAAEVSGTGRETHLSPNPGRVAPRSTAFTLGGTEGVRRPLAVELSAGGRPLFVVVVHLSSKSGDDRLFGPVQPAARPTEALRLAQAKELRAFVDRLLAADPGALLVVLGDFNDLETSPALTALAAPPLDNLVLRVPAEDRYSFNFEGLSQQLDHVVASPKAAEGARVEVVHVNADCPDPLRSSDHDPVLVRLAIDRGD